MVNSATFTLSNIKTLGSHEPVLQLTFTPLNENPSQKISPTDVIAIPAISSKPLFLFQINPLTLLTRQSIEDYVLHQDYVLDFQTISTFYKERIEKGPLLIKDLEIAQLVCFLKNDENAYQIDKSKIKILFETNDLFFDLVPSKFLTPELPNELMAAVPLLEDLNIISRICHPTHPGCYPGESSELLKIWSESNY